MYRDNRRDRLQIHAVTLYIALEKAVEEPWELDERERERKTEYLGRGKFGHVYLKPIHETALKHWPTVKADLTRWLRVGAAAEQ